MLAICQLHNNETFIPLTDKQNKLFCTTKNMFHRLYKGLRRFSWKTFKKSVWTKEKLSKAGPVPSSVLPERYTMVAAAVSP